MTSTLCVAAAGGGAAAAAGGLPSPVPGAAHHRLLPGNHRHHGNLSVPRPSQAGPDGAEVECGILGLQQVICGAPRLGCSGLWARHYSRETTLETFVITETPVKL